MMRKKEIERWLSTLPDNADVAVDEGGLNLVEVKGDGEVGEAYLEVGGVPLDDDGDEV